MARDRWTTSAASSSVFCSRAFAAASAYGPPLPMAARSSSGSMISPSPESSRSWSRVGADQHRLEVTEIPVGPPFLGQPDGGAEEVKVSKTSFGSPLPE